MRLSLRHRLLLVIVALQVLVLASTMLLQGARVEAGQHVRVAVRPVDPLDLARGAYVDLRYEFERLDPPQGQHAEGDDWFVELEEPEQPGSVWRPRRIVADVDELQDPDAFIRLPVAPGGRLDTSPIGTYYASRDSAQRLERELAAGDGVAILSLDRDGRPQLVEVLAR